MGDVSKKKINETTRKSPFIIHKDKRKRERRKREREKKGKRETEIPQLLTATEIVIMGQHEVQLRDPDGPYLSDRSESQESLLQERNRKCQLSGRVVRSLKYHLVTVLKSASSSAAEILFVTKE